MNIYKNIKVLLIEGRARQVLPVSKALREMGCEVTTYNSSKLDPGYASKYPHRKLLAYCDIHNPEDSFMAIKKELEVYKYDLEGNFCCSYISTKEASKDGFNKSHVANVCRGIERQHKEYLFSYKKLTKEQAIQRLSNTHYIRYPKYNGS